MAVDLSRSLLLFVLDLVAEVVLVDAFAQSDDGFWAFERDRHCGSWFTVSMIPITIAMLRYAVDVDGGMAGEPEDIILSDRVLQLLGLAWIATICAAIALA